MNILLVTDLYLPNVGGVEIVINNLARQFVKNGHEVNIIASKWPKSLQEHEKIGGIDIYRVHFAIPRSSFKSWIVFSIRFPQTLLQIIRIIRSTKVDIINVHYVAGNAFYVLLLNSLLRLPLVVSIHGSDIKRNPYRSIILRWTLTMILKRSDFVTSNSLSLLRDAEMFCRGIHSKSLVVGNGIDLREFQELAMYEARDPYILAIGRLVHAKGFDILLYAFKSVANYNPHIHLIVAGDGEERQNLELLTQQLGLTNKVKFIRITNREDIIRLLSGCQFFVLPSRREGFGIVILEAMASKRAVVATEVGGPAEIIKDGENGILAKSLDSKSLAKAITYLLENPEMRKKMGENGRKLVEEKYTWDKIVSKYLKIYGEILQKTNN